LILFISVSSPAVARSGSGSEGSSDSGSSGSGSSGPSISVAAFALTATLPANYKPPSFVGNVVPGGLPSCVGCTTAVESRYVGTSFDCFCDANTISVVSLNDFSGNVTLEVLNLPAGVTSQIAKNLAVPRRGVVSTPFKLQARGDSIVHTCLANGK
jgi:hypothetical protein